MNHLAPMKQEQTLLPRKVESKIPYLFDLSAGSTHVLTESRACYSVVFNMLGVEQKQIGIDVNVQNREITVFSGKEREKLGEGFFWRFGVPIDARLSEMTARFNAGVLEIVIPKISAAMKA